MIETVKRIKIVSLLTVLLATSLLLSGCPSSMSGSAYNRNQARTAQQAQLGTVQGVREVLIEGTKTHIGTATGAALGGIAASNIGGGRGKVAASIGGAVLGGLAGAAAEEAITRQPGLEITVLLDNGRTVTVTQAADEPFAPGERVRLITGPDGTARVTH